MYDRVKQYMLEHHMIEPGMVVLAGVSGGADSVAMLSMLHRFSQECAYTLRVVHVHHGIRGDEADRDQKAVEELCKNWGIPFQCYAYDVPALAAQWKMGLEEAGREVRRRAFEEEKREVRRLAAEEEKREAYRGLPGEEKRCAAEKNIRVALAHNRNDLAETMLHNLARGSGIRGLVGIRPVDGDRIRPVLCLKREEIVQYLAQEKLAYVQDSTNQSDAYTRNRIRRHILPQLEQQVNTRAVEHMAETASVLAEAEAYFTRMGSHLAEKYKTREGEFLLDEAFFEQEGIIQEYTLRQILWELSGKRRDFSSVHIRNTEKLWRQGAGKELHLPGGIVARNLYGKMRIFRSGQVSEGELETGKEPFSWNIFPYNGQEIPEKQCTKWLDYDKIKCGVCIRSRMPGDFMIVDGKGTVKKLTRVMIDDKIPKEQRDFVPLLACGQEILWIAGGRMNEWYKINPDTKRVLELKYQGG